MASTSSSLARSGAAAVTPARVGTRVVCSRVKRVAALRVAATAAPEAPASTPAQATGTLRPDAAGRFGKFGGKYVPETLIPALAELEAEYAKAQADPSFQVRWRAQSG